MSVLVWKFFKKEITNLREIIGNPLLCKHEHINTLWMGKYPLYLGKNIFENTLTGIMENK